MYGVEPTFWLKLVFLIAFAVIAIFSFNAIMRRCLKVEKPKRFSHNYVNDLHKKIDWSIRGLIAILIIIGGFVNIGRIPSERILLLEVWSLLFTLIIATEIVRAVIEWKYAENPKAYIMTISQLVFLVILISSIFATDFFGIFSL